MVNEPETSDVFQSISTMAWILWWGGGHQDQVQVPGPGARGRQVLREYGMGMEYRHERW